MKQKTLLKLSIALLSLLGSSVLAKQNVYAGVSSNMVQPKDGLWKAQMSSSHVTGCPPMMKSMIEKQGIKSQSKRVNFSKPFHPNSLFEESGQLKWKKVGTNKWKAVMHQGENGMSVNITWSIGVVNETKMNISSNVSMILPAQIAAMFGGSKECKADAMGIYKYISN